jgi:hypothetical protein
MDNFLKNPNIEGITMLVVGVNDSTFKGDFTSYTQKLSDQKDNFLMVYGNEPREADFAEDGTINAVRGGIAGEELRDATVEIHEEYDEEYEEWYEEEVTVDFGGIQEAYSLYDAINNSVAKCLRRCTSTDSDVKITIMTDRGIDYGSNTSRSKAKDIITRCIKWGWKINLLVDGSERDVTSVAEELGIDTSRAYNYDTPEEAIEIAKSLL